MRNKNFSNTKSIVVTGIGVSLPVNIDLLNKNIISKHQPIHLETLPHDLNSRQLKKLDKFSVIAINAIKQALNNIELSNSLKTGFIIGNVLGGWDYVEEQMYALYQGDFSAVNAYVATAWFPAAAQGEISILLGCEGYSKTISADTLSAAYAIEHAIHLIEDNVLETVLCGGVEAPVTSIVEHAIPIPSNTFMSDAGIFFCLQDKQNLRDKTAYKFIIETIQFGRDIHTLLALNEHCFKNMNSIVLSQNIAINTLSLFYKKENFHYYTTEEFMGNTYGAAFAFDLYLAYQASHIHGGKTLIIRKSDDGQYVLCLIDGRK